MFTSEHYTLNFFEIFDFLVAILLQCNSNESILSFKAVYPVKPINQYNDFIVIDFGLLGFLSFSLLL